MCYIWPKDLPTLALVIGPNLVFVYDPLLGRFHPLNVGSDNEYCYVGFFMRRSFKRSTPAAVLARGPYLQERTPVDVTVVVTAPSRNDDKEGLGGGCA